MRGYDVRSIATWPTTMAELIEWEHKGQTHIGTFMNLIDELKYANYAYNRKLSPDISPADWVTIYGFSEAMEQRYQQEHGIPHV